MRILILVVALMTSAVVTASAETKCTTVLTLEVFDNEVYPPFAHGNGLIQLLDASPNHRILSRKGPTFQVATSDAEGLLADLMQRNFPKIVRATYNNMQIPFYATEGQPNLPESDFERGRRRNLFKAMELLPEGLYRLSSEGDMVTMIVRVEQNALHAWTSAPSPSLIIELWPGWSRLPHSEKYFKEKMLASFDSSVGVSDSFNVISDNGELELIYSLPYARGTESLRFKFRKSGQFVQVNDSNDREYFFEEMFPLIRR